MTLANGNYEKIHHAPSYLRGLSYLGKLGWPSAIRLHGKKPSRLAGRLGQVDRVLRVGSLPCLVCKRFNAFSEETYEKLAIPG